ncbi:hypothetical protein HNY73_005714 [Argiope bruennichi]|uniref:Uncharacterized protein n=1 Tax=Argiope bruennichi TaxID=94029 RepID=A0A8T0FKH3_ARGBR|nr:hypothetical protein HNY73_005714 [Argiope bruennichi]
MSEYEELGHMSPNKDFDSSKPDYFLPHHVVQKKDSITTKLRVVLDGSSKPPNSNLLNSVLRQLWLLKIDWDNALPEHFAVKWRKFKKEFQQICHISIPRWLLTTEREITLHGFSDASKSAYACIIYAVQRSDNGDTKTTILATKSKVGSSTKAYSRVVLSWLSSPPRNWKPFVANRTSEILDLIPQNRWRYVPSKENPADIGSRSLSSKDLPDCRLWWEGPTFLSSSEADWPKQPIFKNNDSLLKEKKKKLHVYLLQF